MYLEHLLQDNLGVVDDLDAPLAGKTLALCNATLPGALGGELPARSLASTREEQRATQVRRWGAGVG